MLRTTFRSLWSHKLRLLLSTLAIVLGTAFMSGTLVLNSTVGRVFDDLFADLGEGVGAVVRGDELFESERGDTERVLLNESLVEQVAAVDGVAAAEGSMLTDQATIIDAKGDPLGGAGPPTLVGSWDTDPEMAAYQVAEGRAPSAPGEAIIDRSGADKGDFSIGDDVEIIGIDGKSEELRLVGISRFGEADSAGGSIFLGVTLPEAQRIAGEPGRVNQINVRPVDGVSDEDLVERIDAADLSDDLDVVTGEEASAEQASSVKEGLGFFTTALLVFAFIALFVAWFIISNTFSILLAQRTRELALLRAIGATRRQVLTSTMVEAVLVGLVAAVIGFLAGIGLAGGALAALEAFGVDMPSTSLLVTPTTGVTVVVTGVLVTLVAAAMPAVRATRIPPIAALRDVAVDKSGTSKIRAGAGVLFLVLGAVMVGPAFGSEPTTDDLPGIGLGLALLVVSVLVLGPVLARPLARVAGSWLPSVRGVIGRLARENAMRSPRRTASTAAALIIGVSLVVFITIFASSTQASISKALGSGFNSDYLVLPINQNATIGAPPEMAERLAEVPGVEQVDSGSVVVGQVELPDGDDTGAWMYAIDPDTFTDVYDVTMSEGQVSDLTPGTVIVDRSVASENDLSIGDKVKVNGEGGRSVELTVAALGDDPVVLGPWTLNRVDAAELLPALTDAFVGITLEPGTSVDGIRSDLRDVVDDYKNVKLQDKEQFENSLVGLITALLNVIYALLAVSILIAFIGILNTMLLAIHERTRELGLLRAMGMTRSQMRSVVRWEAVIVSLIGTGLGLALGLGMSFVMVKALASQGIEEFDVQVTPMIVIVVAAVVFGIAAAAWPARKAAKLNVLEAISTE